LRITEAWQKPYKGKLESEPFIKDMGKQQRLGSHQVLTSVQVSLSQIFFHYVVV
jgi:hypothetical protein